MVTRLTSSLLLPLIITSWFIPLTVRSDMGISFISTDTIRPCESKDSLYIDHLLKAGALGGPLAERSINELHRSKHVFKIKIIKKGISSFTALGGSGSVWWRDAEVGYPIGSEDTVGCGGTVCFNPGYGKLITTDSVRCDTVMNFLHELLGHGWMANFGFMRQGKIDDLEYAEWQATHFENRLRAEASLPLRLYYNATLKVNTDTNDSTLVPQRPLLVKDSVWSVYMPCYNYKDGIFYDLKFCSDKAINERKSTKKRSK